VSAVERHPASRRLRAWLTSAFVTLAVLAPTAVQAAETYIQKPGH
jgi:hypothetical protein